MYTSGDVPIFFAPTKDTGTELIGAQVGVTVCNLTELNLSMAKVNCVTEPARTVESGFTGLGFETAPMAYVVELE